MNRLLLLAFALIFSISVTAQISFTDESGLLNDGGVRSGVAMGVADMNADGLDDVVRMNDRRNLIIEYQQAGGGQFSKYYHGDIGAGTEWGMCIADVDSDGFRDILVGGAYNRLKVFLMDANGVDSVYWMPLPDIFLQAVNFADIDNDGMVDLFACHDDGVGSPYRNLGNNHWMYDLTLINAVSTNPSDNSGNYGSVWTDYDSDGDLDLYISKCRGGASNPADGRRTNLLFENDGSNNFSNEVAASVGLQPGAQSWSTDFADIDNDGDLDAFIVNHDSSSFLYENVNNQFVNITHSAGMFTILDNWSIGIQAVFDDFDNDSYVDLLVTGDHGHHMWRNNGDKTFTDTDAFADGTPGIHSLGVGDLNDDGFLDILGGFANGYNSPSQTPDRIFTNDGNNNCWFKVELEGTTSNKDGIGARVELYGNWGKQIREIRAGEGYGIVTSFEAHFGLGTDTIIDSLVVIWPSGIRDVIVSPNKNSELSVIEDFCNSNTSIIDLDETICEGESYAFFGSELTLPGNYEETVLTMNGCRETTMLDLSVTDIDESVTQEDNTLIAAAGLSYLWIDCGNGGVQIVGENSQSFTPSVDGSYAVVITDENCLDTSACFDLVGTATFEDIFPFTVDVYPNPASKTLHIAFGNTVEATTLRIQTVHGAVVYDQDFFGSQYLRIDLSDFPAGNYFLEIHYDERIGVMQLVKQ